ncbi:MAG: hypothetical protein HFG44_08815 [Oscillospiraceae bacterium]|nr:hypothetical protein [Oscillospiraceae bacterium]
MTKDYENIALQLKSLLTVFAGIDPDNAAALAEIPYAIRPAVELAEIIYTAFANKEVQ